jgi:hypothetical protein
LLYKKAAKARCINVVFIVDGLLDPAVQSSAPGACVLLIRFQYKFCNLMHCFIFYSNNKAESSISLIGLNMRMKSTGISIHKVCVSSACTVGTK